MLLTFNLTLYCEEENINDIIPVCGKGDTWEKALDEIFAKAKQIDKERGSRWYITKLEVI